MTAITILLTAAAAASLLSQSLPLQAASGFGDTARGATTLSEPATDTVYKVGALVIEAPWTRATPGGARVGGAYLKITNTGAESDRLVGGSLPIAAAVSKIVMAVMRIDTGWRCGEDAGELVGRGPRVQLPTARRWGA